MKKDKKLQELLIHQGPPTIMVDVKLKNSDHGELITHFNDSENNYITWQVEQALCISSKPLLIKKDET